MLLSCIQYCSIYPFKRIFLSNCRCRWLLWFIFSLSRAWMQRLRRSQDNGARYTGHMLSSLVAARQDMTCKLGTTSTSSTPVKSETPDLDLSGSPQARSRCMQQSSLSNSIREMHGAEHALAPATSEHDPAARCQCVIEKPSTCENDWLRSYARPFRDFWKIAQ